MGLNFSKNSKVRKAIELNHDTYLWSSLQPKGKKDYTTGLTGQELKGACQVHSQRGHFNHESAYKFLSVLF